MCQILRFFGGGVVGLMMDRQKEFNDKSSHPTPNNGSGMVRLYFAKPSFDQDHSLEGQKGTPVSGNSTIEYLVGSHPKNLVSGFVHHQKDGHHHLKNLNQL